MRSRASTGRKCLKHQRPAMILLPPQNCKKNDHYSTAVWGTCQQKWYTTGVHIGQLSWVHVPAQVQVPSRFAHRGACKLVLQLRHTSRFVPSPSDLPLLHPSSLTPSPLPVSSITSIGTFTRCGTHWASSHDTNPLYSCDLVHVSPAVLQRTTAQPALAVAYSFVHRTEHKNGRVVLCPNTW